VVACSGGSDVTWVGEPKYSAAGEGGCAGSCPPPECIQDLSATDSQTLPVLPPKSSALVGRDSISFQFHTVFGSQILSLKYQIVNICSLLFRERITYHRLIN
jgi:hypothetical protein